MVKVTGIPEQVPKDGVTVIVLTLFVVPEFKPLKERIELDPLMLVNPVLVLSLTQLKVALEQSYLTPADTNRLLNAISILENSKLPDVAYEYAKKAVEFNPESFDSWRTLYAVTNSTPADKELAMTNMKRLDPKNPNPLNTPK